MRENARHLRGTSRAGAARSGFLAITVGLGILTLTVPTAEADVSDAVKRTFKVKSGSIQVRSSVGLDEAVPAGCLIGDEDPACCPPFDYSLSAYSGGGVPRPMRGSAKFSVKGSGERLKAKGRVKVVDHLSFAQSGLLYSDSDRDCMNYAEQGCGGSYIQRTESTLTLRGVRDHGRGEVRFDPGYPAPSASRGEIAVAPPLGCQGLGHDIFVDFDRPASECANEIRDSVRSFNHLTAEDILHERKLKLAGSCRWLETEYDDTDSEGRAIEAGAGTLMGLTLIRRGGHGQRP